MTYLYTNKQTHTHMDKQALEALYESLTQFQAVAPYEMGSAEDKTLTAALELVEDSLFGDLG